jgi:hypothetical protein
MNSTPAARNRTGSGHAGIVLPVSKTIQIFRR